jgi:hypothetical protein
MKGFPGSSHPEEVIRILADNIFQSALLLKRPMLSIKEKEDNRRQRRGITAKTWKD